MSDYLEEGFEDWLRDLPIDFLQYLYQTWQMNNRMDDVVASLNGSDLTYVGPLNTDRPIAEAINFIIKPKKIKPISNRDIHKLNSILKDNGIEESA